MPRTRPLTRHAIAYPVGLPTSGLTFGADVFAPPRPNFLFISIDDLEPLPGHLKADPRSSLSEIRKVLSPNLDRLAGEGVSFRQVYCPAPPDDASHGAKPTGIAARHNGVHGDADDGLITKDRPEAAHSREVWIHDTGEGADDGAADNAGARRARATNSDH
jgi:hypothetical protein